MNPKEHDKPAQELIAKVLLPPDLCPSDPAAIEAMLDVADGEPLEDEQVERMLKKAMGELPVGQREEEEPEWCEDALNEQERELVALHRNEGDELPPEIAEKLRRLREKAKAEEEEDSDDMES